MSTLAAGLRSRAISTAPRARKEVSPNDSPSLQSISSLSSVPSELEQEEKKFDDPYPDFLWMTTEEPHRSRRMAILKAHPEVSLINHKNEMYAY